jgi:hypothetical protein
MVIDVDAPSLWEVVKWAVCGLCLKLSRPHRFFGVFFIGELATARAAASMGTAMVRS